MGIHSWCKSAILSFILLASPSAFSATIVPTPEPSFSSIMAAAQGAIGLPYGDPAYFGPEYTATHTAGSRFQPGSTLGQVMPGAAPKVKVPIKPVVTINPGKLATAVKSAIKGGGVPGIMAQAAVLWAIEQIPGASVSDGGQLVRLPSVQTSGYYWPANLANAYPGYVVKRFSTPDAACKSLWPQAKAPQTVKTKQTGTYSYDCISYDPYSSVTESYIGYTQRTAFNCPNGADPNYQCYASPPTAQPFTDSDFLDLESAIASVTNSDWLRDLTRAKCAGSLSPDACYQDLVSRRPNHGPASQLGPKLSSTTTTQNPDGTTSSTTTTTQNKYDYTYTQNNFTYRTTTTTTTTKDGQTTTTTTQDTTDPSAEPDKEPSDDEEGSEEPISFEDSEMPEVTPFYEQKYPGGLQGVWDSAQSDFQNSEFISFMNSFVPTFSGTCPAWEMSFAISSWANFGTFGFGSLCYVFDFIKVVILVTAVFTARAIVFGG